MILRYADGIELGAEGVFDFHVVLLRAEDDADGRLVTGSALLVVEKIEIEIHLAGKFRLERADLEIECDQRPEETVVKEQVNEILLPAQREPVLPPDERKAVTEFEDEVTQPFDKPVLEFALLHRLADAEELKVVRAFEHLVRLLGEVLRQD